MKYADIRRSSVDASRPGLPQRIWLALSASWAALTGLAPHVLHDGSVCRDAGKTLSTLMAECGDRQIRPAEARYRGEREYDVLPTLDLRRLGVKILCVELHAVRSIRNAQKLLGSVSEQGYALVYVKRPASYTFVTTELRDASTPEPLRGGFGRHGRL